MNPNTMKKISFLSFFLVLGVLYASGQNTGVGINTAGTPPDPSAIFDASSTTQGALFPRMTTAQRDAIQSPAKGLYIYNLDCDNINFNAGTPESPDWVTLFSSNIAQVEVSISASPSGTVCEGETVTLTAASSNGGSSPQYQWKKNGNVISGASGDTYAETAPEDGDVFSCILTSNQPCVAGSPAASNDITLTVDPALTASVSIVASPSGAVCPGTAVTFTTTASNAGSTPVFVWKKNGQEIEGGKRSELYRIGPRAQ
jgi:hypothetical protein